jgi:predicted lipoprotein with Yx(FWY)xxD motif
VLTESESTAREVFRAVPLPPNFHVEATELEGPVFADRNGKTLYTWPQLKLRNGYSGEAAGNTACYDKVITVTAGLMSPYPPGLQLPELDTRPSCTDLWPPVLAEGNAQAIGNWSVVLRRDGARQWAYKEQPLYTSVRDKQAGDTYGGSRRRRGADGGGDGDSPAGRVPAGPPPELPPGFAIKTTSMGRLLTTNQNYAAYAFELKLLVSGRFSSGLQASISGCFAEPPCTPTPWIPSLGARSAAMNLAGAMCLRRPRQLYHRALPCNTPSLALFWQLQMAKPFTAINAEMTR